MRAPYPSRALFFHALSAVSFGYLAFYRGDLYSISSSAWVLSAAVGALGLVAPLALPAGMRSRLLTGAWPLVIALPFLAFAVGPGLVPSPLTVGPFLFCAGASLTTCALVACNVSRRKRCLRRLVADEVVIDETHARSQLEAYFAAEKAFAEEGLKRAKPLHRALRAQAWLPSRARRRHAAVLLRDYADFLERDLEAGPEIPVPSETLRTHVDRSHRFSGQLREAFLSVALQLEKGARLFRWKTWLISNLHAGVDNDRDLFYAVGVIAKRHGASYPEWFRRIRRVLGRTVLTPTDIAPPWKTGALTAKPLALLFAVVVLANMFLATATAHAPAPDEGPPPDPPRLRDAGPLPVIAGSSSESRIEPRLSRVASSLAGRRAEVRCWSPEDWEKRASEWARWPSTSWVGSWGGYTSADGERVNLAPAVCVLLARLAYQRVPVDEAGWPDGLAWSVELLAHEAQHVSGIVNEARAECYGMQSIITAARALGRTAKEGRYLAWLYWENSYPNGDAPYRSRECRNGGRLDLHPRSDVWP